MGRGLVEMPIQLTDLNLDNKTVLARVDYNVPVQAGRVVDDTRITASFPTLRRILAAEGAKLILISHLGRPDSGRPDERFTLAPVADCLSSHLGFPVPLIRDWVDGIDFAGHRLVLCENVRFQKGEVENDECFSRKLAALCDVYVNDAFATAHRAQASTHGVAEHADVACAGTLLLDEIETLQQVLRQPARPLVAVVGGAKVFGKIELLNALAQQVDCLLLGGGIANTFLAATGCPVGASLYEPEQREVARQIISVAEQGRLDLPLPTDVVCASALDDLAEPVVQAPQAVCEKEMILDLGPSTSALYRARLCAAATILWNGPLGVFEQERFGTATRELASAVAESPAFSVAGGGDTLAAIARYQVADRIDYISTGGGAFLAFMEGRELPAVAILSRRAAAVERVGHH